MAREFTYAARGKINLLWMGDHTLHTKFPLNLGKHVKPLVPAVIYKSLAVITDLLLFTFLMLTGFAYARISVMYAHDKLSDIVAEQCLKEMYPKHKHIEIEESDGPCIIFCVLKKFGIMNANGVINLEVYKKRVKTANQLDQRNSIADYGATCMESAEATQHKQDVCKKAKVFNDCTHLYRILI